MVASNAGAEATDRAVPGETVSPSNAQHPSMVVPSTVPDNASTLASLRMVSYTEGYASCAFCSLTHLFLTPPNSQTSFSALPIEKVNIDCSQKNIDLLLIIIFQMTIFYERPFQQFFNACTSEHSLIVRNISASCIFENICT